MFPCLTRYQERLESLAVEKTRLWWENYLKGVIPFLGVGIPAMRELLYEMYQAEKLAGWPREDLLELAHELFRRQVAEYKLSAVLLYQEFFLPAMEPEVIINSLEQIYDEGHIYDWNTSDWLCVRVLTPMVERMPGRILDRLDRWISSENLWMARSALVALCQLQDPTAYREKVFRYCDILLARPERFAWTAVGWMLREYSRRDWWLVEEYLLKNRARISTEVFNNACKYLQGEEKKALREKVQPCSDRGLE